MLSWRPNNDGVNASAKGVREKNGIFQVKPREKKYIKKIREIAPENEFINLNFFRNLRIH